MADDKSQENGYDVTAKVIGFIIIVFILGTILAKYGYGSGESIFVQKFDGDGEIVNEESNIDKGFSLSSVFPSGNISLGERIINKKEISVHREPAGRIIGQQPKRELGKVVEGPENTSDYQWWRIDYKNAPDGWVKGEDLSVYVWGYRLLNIFPIVFGTLIPFMILLSIIIFVLIIVVLMKMKNLEKLKQKKLDHARGKDTKDEIRKSIQDEKETENSEELDEKNMLIANLPTGDNVPKTKDIHNKRWAKVETLINSHNINDWKQAIIEADIILDEMLEKMGYKGETIAEKLKQVEESDFLTLNQAWEAHKIRNKIAHTGDYVLSKGVADKTIANFREVFQEFYFI